MSYGELRRPSSGVLSTARCVPASYVCAVIVFFTGFGHQASSQEPTGIDAALALERVFVDVAARCENSVVAVARARKGIASEKLTDPTFTPNEFGTGVVVDRRGLVLTNLHVLGDPQQNDYAVWLKRRPFRATVKATDPWTDLAVLEVEADDLKPITFGDADNLRKGQIVLSLGNPYGIAHDGEVSVCWGIVSNLLRKAPAEPDANRSSGLRRTVHHFGTLIQTDAKLHLGTSGGALVNLRGEMVGLTTSLAARAGYEKSIGYAIPVSDAFRRAVSTLKQGREVEHGLLGVVPGTETRDLAYDSRRRGEFGVKVLEVFDGTPAAKSNLRGDDLITHIDGRPVYDSDHLIMRVGSLPAGKDVELTYQRVLSRSTRTSHETVRLSKKAPDAERLPIVTAGIRQWRGVRVDYATAIPGFAARRYVGQMDPRGCVGIVDVEQGSAAQQAGLSQGMFVSHVDGQRVTLPDEFHAAVARTEGNVSLKVSSERGDYVTRIVPDEDDGAAEK